MPWNECKPMDERLKFIARLLDGQKSAAADFCAINGMEYRINDDDTDDMRFMHRMVGSVGGDDTYTIDPIRGMLWDADDSLELSTHHDRSNYHLNIEVNSTGDVIVCSRSSNEAVPGYKVCS